MDSFPLYDLVREHRHEPITQMQAYVRDDGRSWEEIEVRRKEALRNRLSDLKEGVHPILVVLEALDDVIGSLHPMRHMINLIEDQNSFRHKFMPRKPRKNGKENPAEEGDGKPEKTEEEFQRERKQHIEKLIGYNFSGYGFRGYNLATPDQITSITDKLTARLDNPDEGSLEIAKDFFNYFVAHEYARHGDEISKERGLGAIIAVLDKMIDNEAFDRSVHPNERYIDGDVLDILAAYEPRTSYEEVRTRDKYQTQEDIELRRSMEVVGILEKWKAGAHALHVITDVMDVATGKHDLGLESMATYARIYQQSAAEAKKEKVTATPKELARAEDEYVRLMHDQTALRRKARKVIHAMREDVIAYRGPETHPEFAAQIDAFIEHLMQTDEPSLSIVQGVAEAIFEPIDDRPYVKVEEPDQAFWDDDFRDHKDNEPEDPKQTKETYGYDAPLLTRIRVKLRNKQKDEDAHFEKLRPMGKLATETEAHVKECLKDTFARRVKDETAPEALQTSLLITDMRIDATGSALIKPYPTGPYDDHCDEDLYGTTTARITTYSVSLIPQDPSDIQELAARVKTALEEIAEIKPAYEIPFDMTAKYEAYERPVRTRQWSSKDPIRYENTYVTVHDDHVQIETRLDLDDVWNLYYLLEDIIEPNAQIAAAMNAARYAEERGVLLQKSDINSDYSNQNLKPEEQMGALDNVDPEDYVPTAMEHTLKLYALGEIDEEQLLQSVLVLADHTLAGRMLDPAGLLPTFNRLTDQSERKEHDGAVMTYDEALRERTRDILRIMTGTYDEDRPLFPALIKKVAEISKPLRDQLRGVALKEEIAFRDRMWGHRSEVRRDLFERLNEGQEDNVEDTDTKVKFASAYLTEEEIENRANIARRSNLVLRDSEVGVTSDRTWRDTTYVSRSKNSLWVRKELPSTLKPFITPTGRPDMSQALLSIGYQP